ncbi:MAG: ribosomal protein large subunit ribosomal protein [Candidatus Taylorbacteria bacterium]|nr:ribosomal protein large subunit ribosomal protein [Candidatus Taylorbacteria bacterium]
MANSATKTAENKEFAIIANGGKQYQVSVGDLIKIEKISAEIGKEYKEGDAVTFDQVLLVDNGSDTTIGAPFIPKAAVTGKITKIGRLAKVNVIKFKQKSKYFKKNGHRQPFFEIKIDAIK